MLRTNELCSDYSLVTVCYPDECGDQAAKFCGVQGDLNQIADFNFPNHCHIVGKDVYYNHHNGDRHYVAFVGNVPNHPDTQNGYI